MDKLKVFLVGISGSSTDLQLAVFSLQATLAIIHPDVEVQIGHYDRIPAEHFETRCLEIAFEACKSRAQVIGFSVYIWNVEACRNISKIIKSLHPEINIVFGGPEVAPMESWADCVIQDEGELPFAAYIQSVLSAKKYWFEPITAESLDSLPSPYLTGFIPDELLQRPGFKALIETQRGCNFRCAYCRYNQSFPTIRYRSLETVLKEVEYIQEHGGTHLRIADGNFLSDKDRATLFLQELKKRNIALPLFFEVTPSFVTPEFAKAMNEYPAGITIGLGLQTVNAEALRIIRRPTSIEPVKRSYEYLSKTGATIITDVILGLPRETFDSYLNTLEFMLGVMRNPHHILAVSLLRILPDTDMESIAGEEKIIYNGDQHFVYQTPTLNRDELVACARLTAALYRTVNSQFRGKFYKLNRSPLASLQIVADRLSFKDDLEQNWLFNVYNEFSDAALERLLA
jgi:radical SAM superfamily enzyme YgiQ (UPF0313 family)